MCHNVKYGKIMHKQADTFQGKGSECPLALKKVTN